MPQLHRIGPKPSGQMPSSGSLSRTHNLVHLEVSFQEYTYTNKHSPQQHPIPGPILPNTTEEDISSTIDVTFLSHRRKGTPFGSFEDKVIVMSSKTLLVPLSIVGPPYSEHVECPGLDLALPARSAPSRLGGMLISIPATDHA